MVHRFARRAKIAGIAGIVLVMVIPASIAGNRGGFLGRGFRLYGLGIGRWRIGYVFHDRFPMVSR